VNRRSLIVPAAVIFDFDLTLVDSRPGFVASHRYASEHLGVPAPNDEAIARAIGTPLERAMSVLFPEMGPDLAAEYIRVYRMNAEETMAQLTTVLPGARDAIDALHGTGIRLAMVSQKFRYLVEPVLAREGWQFEVVLGGEDVPAYKPDPAGLLLALQQLGVDAEDAIFVGDTTVDAQAAAKAGLRFIGVLTGPTTHADFDSLTALTLLDSVADLPGYLGL
jgi:phosphoglycolate phosphatase